VERTPGCGSILDHLHAAVLGGTFDIEVALTMKMLADLHILVLGLGSSGLAMVRWCVLQGAKVTVVDNREQPPCLATMRSDHPEVTFIHGSLDASTGRN
jgi:UDP-N-acetylmuramoylalanine-D-glutamate ligase